MNWSNPLLISLIPAILFGVFNYYYNRKRGFTNIGTLIIGIMAFYAIFYLILSRLR
jgi:hypothetical protein